MAVIWAGSMEWRVRAAHCASEILQLIPADVVEEEEPERGLSLGHLKRMARMLAERQVDSDTKACRWLGWLQAGIVAAGLSTLEQEKMRNLASAAAWSQNCDNLSAHYRGDSL